MPSSSSAAATTSTTKIDDSSNKRTNYMKPVLLDPSVDEDSENESLLEFSDNIHARQDFLSIYSSLSNFGLLGVGGEEDNNSVEDALEDLDITVVDKLKKKDKEYQQKQKQQIQDDTIEYILKKIHEIEIHTRQKGMKEWNFTFGLLNCLLIAYIFGAYPGYFWIVYMIQSTFWIISKFMKMYTAKPLCEVFYYFDFCWCMNFVGLTLFTIFTFAGSLISSELRKEFFYASFGIATGPVFMAAMTLPFVAFLFHDTNTMTNLIIHTLPCMLNYILKWKPNTMKDAFPNLFDLEYLLGDGDDDDGQKGGGDIPFWDSSENGFGFNKTSVARNAIIIYMLWFIPYVIWMLCIGLQLPISSPNKPKPVYDTVFHSLWRDGPCVLVGKLIWKRSPALSKEQSKTNNFEMRDFMLYIIGHLLACLILGINVLARLCYTNQILHGIFIFVAVAICSKRGASRYTYYATAMYSKKIQNEFMKEKQKQSSSSSSDDKKNE